LTIKVGHVILSAAKNLTCCTKILRCAQNDSSLLSLIVNIQRATSWTGCKYPALRRKEIIHWKNETSQRVKDEIKVNSGDYKHL